MGGMGSIILAYAYIFDLINFCINPAIDTEKIGLSYETCLI